MMHQKHQWLKSKGGSIKTKHETDETNPELQPAQAASEHDPAAGVAQEDDERAALFAMLDRARQQWTGPAQATAADFVVCLLGGKWLMEQTGLPYDAFMGKAKQKSRGEAFLVQYGMQKTKRFFVSKFGMDEALALAHGWCHRMSYFFDIWAESGNPNYKFTEADLGGYSMPQEVVQVLSRLRGTASTTAVAAMAIAPS